jgi:mRNA-degrading endonuclease YafQ of YafQ-DinJ toxin-antitoxin module
VRRKLIRSSAFVRAARRTIRKPPFFAQDIQAALEQMEEDVFQSRLHTHKLKGILAGSWAPSAGFDLRIVFKFVEFEGAEAILLETIGTHEEVY